MKRYVVIPLLVAGLVAALIGLSGGGPALAHGNGPTDGLRPPWGPMTGTVPGPQEEGPVPAMPAGGFWGRMQNFWHAMMGNGMMGNGGFGGMMGNWGWFGGGTPLSDDQVRRIAADYVAAYGNNLEVAEIMAFDNHFYVQAREKDSGRYAFEFLVDRYSGAVHPEPGPNMMWNAKYGHMAGFGCGGMMGGAWRSAQGEMPITPEEAVQIAQDYLNRYRPGWEAADEADPFYGYYTIHVLQDGNIVGMLSVNGYTGQVWPHTWHGQFLGMVTGENH